MKHESNGEMKRSSFSWTRYYLVHHWGFSKKASLSIKHWDKLNSDDNDNMYSELVKSYGKQEINFKCNKCLNKKWHFNILGRYNHRTKRSGIKADMIFVDFPFLEGNIGFLNLFVQYWNGYGESLERHDKRQVRISIGAAYGGDYTSND